MIDSAQSSNVVSSPPRLPLQGAVSDVRTWLAAALLSAAVIVAFWPCLDNTLSYSDADPVAGMNAREISAQPAPLTLTIVVQGGSFQPLARALRSAEQRWWGVNPRGYHAVSLALHTVNSVLVYLLGLVLIRAATRHGSRPRPTLAEQGGALLGAALFALHPLRVEPVAWAAQGGLLLSVLFLLVATLFYFEAAGAQRRGGWWVLALLCFALSLAAGPIGLAWPITLLVLDWFPLSRFSGRGGGNAAARWGGWWEKVPLLILSAGAAIVTGLAQRLAPPPFSVAGGNLVGHIVQAVYGWAFYPWKTCWPLGLAPCYEPMLPLVPLSEKYVIAIVVVLAAVFVLVRFGRQMPSVLAALVCYTVLLLPVTLLLWRAPEEAADRYSYLPCIALAPLLGGGLSWLWMMPSRAVRGLAGGLTVLALAAAVALGGLTSRQCQVWRSAMTVWTHAVGNCPESGVAQYQLGRQFEQAGELERAMQLYRSAIGRRGTFLPAYLAFGGALLQMGRPDGAVDVFRQALTVDPRSPSTHLALGEALAADGQLAQAEEHLRRAVALDPAALKPRSALGHLLMLQQRWREAADAFRAALVIAPGNAELHYDLGRACLEAGDRVQAAEAFRRALDIDPQHKLARRALENLGS